MDHHQLVRHMADEGPDVDVPADDQLGVALQVDGGGPEVAEDDQRGAAVVGVEYRAVHQQVAVDDVAVSYTHL